MKEVFDEFEETVQFQQQDPEQALSLLECIIRNLILHQAQKHGCYDSKRHLVALPCVVYTSSPNPRSMVHWKCPSMHQAEESELNMLKRKDEAVMHLKV